MFNNEHFIFQLKNKIINKSKMRKSIVGEVIATITDFTDSINSFLMISTQLTSERTPDFSSYKSKKVGIAINSCTLLAWQFR
jgi:hypothetical protein